MFYVYAKELIKTERGLNFRSGEARGFRVRVFMASGTYNEDLRRKPHIELEGKPLVKEFGVFANLKPNVCLVF